MPKGSHWLVYFEVIKGESVNHSVVPDFATPWTVAFQASLSLGFSRQEYWSGVPFPPPGDLPDPRIEIASLMSPELAGGFFTTSATWEARTGVGGAD